MLYSQLVLVTHSLSLSLLCNRLLGLFMFVHGHAADAEENIHLFQSEAFCLRHKEIYKYYTKYHKASKEKESTVRYVGQHIWG